MISQNTLNRKPRYFVLRQHGLCLLALLLCLSFAMSVRAQVTVAPFVTPSIQFSDNNGNPLNGGCVFFYAAGTTTPQATFTDSTGTVQASNPVILDSSGRAQIWLSGLAYKIKVFSAGGLNCATGSQVGVTVDNVTWSTPLTTFTGLTVSGNMNQTQPTAATSLANQSSFTSCQHGTYWNGSVSADDKWCLQDVLGTGTNPTSTLTVTHSGSSGTNLLDLSAATTTKMAAATVTGALSAASLNGDPLTTTPLNAILGIGDSNCLSLTSSTFVHVNLFPCLDMTGGSYSAGNTSMWGNTTVTGTFNLSPVGDGIAGQTTVYGTINNNGNYGAGINGVEGQASSTASGGVIELANGIVGSGIDTFSGNTAFTYSAGLHAGPAVKSGSGTITGNFDLMLDAPGSPGTVNYGIWNRGNHLMDNGTSISWAAATLAGASASMSGCPGACLVTVTKASHGYTSNDFISYDSANKQYTGFYQITATGANTFTFPAKFNYASNAAADASPLIQKIPSNASSPGTSFNIAVGTDGSFIFNNPFVNTTSNGAFQWCALGSCFMNFKTPFIKIDPANIGFALEIGASSGIKMDASGSTLTSTEGSGNNIVVTSFSGTTAGLTVPFTLGATAQKSETASADTNVLTVTPAAAAGTYRACFTASVSSATAGVIGWTLSWTDSSGNAQSNIAMSLFQEGTAAPANTFTVSSAGNYDSCHSFDVNNAGANIVVKWVGGGTSAAKVSATVERLQ